MKRFGLIALLIILIIIVGLISINFGPVWFQRLFGFYAKIEKNTYPQWINNEEYCYVKVINYYDPTLGGSMLPPGFNPFFMFRGPNATFYIYKVNINKPEEQKLIRKITAKVTFWISDFWKRLDGDEFIFRRLDNGELILLVKGRKEYPTYYLDTNGKLLRERIFDYDFIEGGFIGDISPDGEKILLGEYIKDVVSGQKIFFYSWKDKWFGPTRWISENNLIIYKPIYLEDKNKKVYDPEKIRFEVYFVNENRKNIELVCSKDYLKYSEYDKRYKELPSSEDAALYPDQNLLFLSKIGIFKKEAEKWQEIKDLNDMEFNLYYPDWSPDGKRLVGVIDSKNIKIIDVKDLLKE